MTKYCCGFMKTAIEEDTIRVIDYYEHQKDGYSIERVNEPIKKGYYIIDQYGEGEMCNQNYPSKPQIPLSYCPYCGTELEETEK